jgi:hypothetical protein
VFITIVTVNVLAAPGRLAKVTVEGDDTPAVAPPQAAGATKLNITGVVVVAVPPVKGVTVNHAGRTEPVPTDVSTVNGVPRFEVEETGTKTAGPGA